MADLAADPSPSVRRMQAITDGLRAAGLAVLVNQSKAGWDLTAALAQPSQRAVEAIVDEDGYVELRYWNRDDATPAQITHIITAALAVVCAAPGEPR